MVRPGLLHMYEGIIGGACVFGNDVELGYFVIVLFLLLMMVLLRD